MRPGADRHGAGTCRSEWGLGERGVGGVPEHATYGLSGVSALNKARNSKTLAPVLSLLVDPTVDACALVRELERVVHTFGKGVSWSQWVPL